MKRTNLLNDLGIDLFADPAGAVDPRFAQAANEVKKSKAPVEPDEELEDEDDSEDENPEEELEESDDDSEEEEDEDLVSKEELDKAEKNLSAARKETRHLKQLLRAVGIDPKLSIAEAKAALDKGEDTYEGPSEREIKRFNRAVRGELKAAGFDDKIAKLLVSQFDINEDEDDDYISDRIEELKEDFSDFLAAKTTTTKRKTRSDLGQRRTEPKEPKLNSAQLRMKAAGMPYR